MDGPPRDAGTAVLVTAYVVLFLGMMLKTYDKYASAFIHLRIFDGNGTASWEWITRTLKGSIVLKRAEPDEGTVQRDEWTMVGYLPQEGEAVGDETVMDVATGRVKE